MKLPRWVHLDLLISEAIGLQREVLQHRKALFGVFHEDTVSAEGVLAAILVEANLPGEAERLERPVYKFKKNKYGDTDRVPLSAIQSVTRGSVFSPIHIFKGIEHAA